jgi:hypothetical protein
VGIEVKSGATITADQLRPLQRWLALATGAFGLLVNGGDEVQRCSDLRVLPWRGLADPENIQEILAPASPS